MELYDVVKKLTGSIRTEGETHIDDQRYENLKITIDLVDKLIGNIYLVSRDINCQEYSRKRSGKKAEEYLKELYEALKENFEDE